MIGHVVTCGPMRWRPLAGEGRGGGHSGCGASHRHPTTCAVSHKRSAPARLASAHPVFIGHRQTHETNMRNLLGIAAVALSLAGTLTAASAATYPNREPLPQAGSHSKPSGGGQERPYLAE